MKKKDKSDETQLVGVDNIESKIFMIRRKKVMIDRELAKLYGVETRQLTRQVRRNIDRFPDDFMFQLNRSEFENLKCQFGTSSWGGTRKLPFVFTEQGVAMLSSVLRSKRAAQVNIQIMRTFIKMRQLLISNEELCRKIEKMEKKYDSQFQAVFQVIKQLLKPAEKPKRKIGF